MPPVPRQQPPPRQAPPQQPAPEDEHAVLAVIVLALLSGATVAAIVKTIGAVLQPLGVSDQATAISVELVVPHVQTRGQGQSFGGAGKGTAAFIDPAGLPVPRGTAQAQIARTGVARQAGYVLSSARRVQGELARAAGAPPLPPLPPRPATTGEPGDAGRNVASTAEGRVRAFGEAAQQRIARATLDPSQQFPVDATVLDQVLERERRYFAQHLAAERSRREAAARVDATSARLGLVTLGWHAVMDSRTTPECRRANGLNFEVARPPAIGYPGTLHGGACRCAPGLPFPGRPLIDEVLIAPTER